MANSYDVVVIGAGTGGYVPRSRRPARVKVASSSARPALGGTCLNWGCIPTKALLEHAHAWKVAQEAREWGIAFDGAPRLDMGQVHARKDKIVKTLTGGVALLFQEEQDRVDQGLGRVCSATARSTSPRAGATAHGQGDRCRDRFLRAQRSGHRDRSPAHHHERRSHSHEGGAEVDRGDGQRRRRRRVRVDLQPLRQPVTVIELLPRLVPNEDERSRPSSRSTSAASRSARSRTRW